MNGGARQSFTLLYCRPPQESPASGLLLAEDIAMAPRVDKKRKCEGAVRKADADALVVTAVARVFWADRKYDKARKWFERAVTLDADAGDAWASYFAFELQAGTPESQAAVERRCVATEPAHGERWQAVAKRVENRGLSRAEVLRRVVVEMAAAAAGEEAALFGPPRGGAAAAAASRGAAATAAAGETLGAVGGSQARAAAPAGRLAAAASESAVLAVAAAFAPGSAAASAAAAVASRGASHDDSEPCAGADLDDGATAAANDASAGTKRRRWV